MPKHLLAALAAIALALPAVPAHAENELYHVKPSCRLVQLTEIPDHGAEDVFVATAIADSSVAVPVSTTIRCTVTAPDGGGYTFWSGSMTTPGAVSVTAGRATVWYNPPIVCAQGAATFSDGVSVETPAC
jgi:hypothetical protein